VDYALIEEFCMNFDSYWKSARLHKQSDPKGGKIFAGPIWDFDNAYGMADFAAGTTGRLQVNLPKFWVRLWADPTFRRDLKCRWNELRKGTITMENIDVKLDKWAKLIAAADARDNAKWKTIGAKVPLVKFIGPDYDSYLQYMRTWIMKRLAWLDPDYAKFPGTCN
jgi:hypothetical protein